MSFSLSRKVAIITGASQGLGLEIARKYAGCGASLVICAREAKLLESAKRDISRNMSKEQSILAVPADVSKRDDIDKLVAATLAKFDRIDILVNNAGIYGAMGPIDKVDWYEWYRAIEINLFGSIFMCRAVLPVMKIQRKGKIIQLSGGGATNPMPNVSAYAVSKAGIVRFAETLAEEVREFGIEVNAIAPGALNTRMLEDVLSAGPEKVGRSFFEKSLAQKESGGAGMAQGSDLAAFLASDESDGISGKLISATWDLWREWPNHLEDLQGSDAYTLRRIVGRDRGFSWGDK
jgi:NAD(P)-dependent dehydrogenase (short-subunit alcohol dehydrogenase family)